MFQSARRVHLLVGGAIGLNLMLGAGAAMGVVPRPVTAENAASVRAEVEPAAAEAAPASAASSPVEATPAPVETTAPPTTPAPITPAPAPTRPTTTAAPVVTAPPATVPPAPAPPTTVAAPTTAPRLNPSDAEVVAAMQLLKAQIPLLPVNAAYGRQFGDAVCSAFDQGNDFAQVKNMVMQAVSQIPLIRITPANADFAVRTAVSLFCPAYASKLV